MKDLTSSYYIGIVIILNVLSGLHFWNNSDNTNKIIQTLKAMQVYSVNQ